MDKNESRDITGLWVFQDADALEDFFLAKAVKEQKLGRVLTEVETHEMLREFRNDGKIGGFEVEGKKENIKAILSEHFNTVTPKKREEEDNV